MSKEDTLRAFYDAFNRDDFDAAIELMHPEVEIYPGLGGVLDIATSVHGRDDCRRFFETISEGTHVVVELKDVVEAGDRLLAFESWRPRGRQGIETEVELSGLYTFRGGLILRVDGFQDRARALEAAGLPE
jgi:ketosteroid isomerase-like protein